MGQRFSASSHYQNQDRLHNKFHKTMLWILIEIQQIHMIRKMYQVCEMSVILLRLEVLTVSSIMKHYVMMQGKMSVVKGICMPMVLLKEVVKGFNKRKKVIAYIDPNHNQYIPWHCLLLRWICRRLNFIRQCYHGIISTCTDNEYASEYVNKQFEWGILATCASMSWAISGSGNDLSPVWVQTITQTLSYEYFIWQKIWGLLVMEESIHC